MRSATYRNTHRSERSGFTLIEMLVVMFIIALLIAILVPALNRAREQAKEVQCKSNLSMFGRAFSMYAEDNRDFLCSGSFDPEISNGRDGPVDQVGWVADLVNGGLGEPSKQLCPSNPATYNQKLRPGGAGTDSYTELEAAGLVARGYNTNYTQAWYMARTAWTRPKSSKVTSQGLNFRRVDSTVGPLRTTVMLKVSPSRVPLLGDGRTDGDETLLGERCTKTMTDGPWGGPYGIQNFADIGPAHGIGSWIRGDKSHNRIRASVLFGDGHVDSFQDLDRDGEFAIDDTRDPPQQKDLDPTKVFDGVLTMGRRSNSNFTME